MLVPAAKITWLLTVLLLLIPAEKAGAPMLMVLPLLVMLTAPVADRLDCDGTEKLNDWLVPEIVMAPPATLKFAVPLVSVIFELASATPPAAPPTMLIVLPFWDNVMLLPPARIMLPVDISL